MSLDYFLMIDFLFLKNSLPLTLQDKVYYAGVYFVNTPKNAYLKNEMLNLKLFKHEYYYTMKISFI